ncbi:hypothetical protein AVEN_189224-1 [Araneus ventricosus]|uniref:Uncharacterized protein n=1 Tax=Araneus ventricosus TaxID=182803 RepID=A0A4Y2SPP8_ARAVE|nr:hypothetical protein AVEN_189224-1 [Araneus ventricosus]
MWISWTCRPETALDREILQNPTDSARDAAWNRTTAESSSGDLGGIGTQDPKGLIVVMSRSEKGLKRPSPDGREKNLSVGSYCELGQSLLWERCK